MTNNNKYANNYDYYKAIWLLNRELLENGFLIVKRLWLGESCGNTFVEFYNDEDAILQNSQITPEELAASDIQFKKLTVHVETKTLSKRHIKLHLERHSVQLYSIMLMELILWSFLLNLVALHHARHENDKRFLFSSCCNCSYSITFRCSTDVDLTAPNNPTTPVVFGLLDAEVDTQWVRINRAWLGDGDQEAQAALVQDSSEYTPERLNAHFVEVINGIDGRTFGLVDTLLENKR